MASGRTNIGGGGGLEIKGGIGGNTGALTVTSKISKVGKGVLTSITGGGQGQIYVDSVYKCSFYVPDSSTLSLLIPYNTSIDIRTQSTDALIASFAIGSHDLKKSTPVIEKYNNTITDTTTLVQSVTGKGFLLATQSNVFGTKIVIDGNTIVDLRSGISYAGGLNLRFNTSLQYFSSSTFDIRRNVIYLLE